jgi:hypothetical protein
MPKGKKFSVERAQQLIDEMSLSQKETFIKACLVDGRFSPRVDPSIDEYRVRCYYEEVRFEGFSGSMKPLVVSYNPAVEPHHEGVKVMSSYPQGFWNGTRRIFTANDLDKDCET